MAYFVANKDGSFATAADWWTGTYRSTTMTTSSGTFIGTTPVYSNTFTAPNTTNACIGILAFVTGACPNNVTATLQESTVDTAATVTINSADMPRSGWYFFKFGTPYTFTTTSANAYRVKFVGSTAGAQWAVETGSVIASVIMDDRVPGAAPGAGDDVWIAGENGASNTRTMTISGNVSLGSGGAAATVTHRSALHALNIVSNGLLNWDTTASSSLTIVGNINVSNRGEYRVGTPASPLSSSYTHTITFDPGTNGDFGFILGSANGSTGKCTLQGASQNWKTTYVSGSGTAASPMITAGDIGVVGDQIVIGGASNNAANYNENEIRYIKTKNSATSYVLSTTSGGAEAALTNTHAANAHIVNFTRNIKITTDDAAKAWFFYHTVTEAGNIDWDWVECNRCGTGSSTREGIYVTSSSGTYGNFDYVSQNTPLGNSSFWWVGSTATQTHNGLVVYNNTSNASVSAPFYLNSVTNITLNDCYFFGANRNMYWLNSAYNITMNRCHANGSNRSNFTGSHAGFTLTSAGVNMVDCTTNCNRSYGVYLSGAVGSTITGLSSGVLGNNIIDLQIPSGAYNDVTLDSAVLSSTTAVSGYLDMAGLSELRFHKLSGTANNHIWYTNKGTARSTGSGLTDTTIRTSSSLGLRLSPEDATDGFLWSFNVPANAGNIVSFFGYAQKNTAFATDVCRFELWLPGSTVADDTFTMSDTTGTWQAVTLSANYTGSVNLLATVKVYALTTTSSAYIYIDDLFNAGDGVSTTSNKLAGMDVWDKGKPATLMVAQTVSAADVWSFATADLTTAGTTGKQLKDALTVAKFLGLK